MQLIKWILNIVMIFFSILYMIFKTWKHYAKCHFEYYFLFFSLEL